MSIERLSSALADRYRIERELGAGGMATVYLAHDLKHDRDVAIKVLHPDLGAALGGDRFLSEIRTTARLQHPHILALIDSGSADGLLYYVMPLATGETLRARLERDRQLPIEEALRIAREVADALGHAHALGIIHRDIKPENILVQGGHAIVADFGIALAVQTAGGSRMTQTGLSLGTPQYMSPEQAMGERTIDARSDIYALGAVTYEMLTGDPPFAGSSVQAIVAKVLTERPTPVRTLRDTVPPGAEHAVMTALAKLPADRFASAADFTAALGGAGGAMPTYAQTAAPSVRSRRSMRIAIAGNVFLAASLLAVFFLRRAPAEPVSRQQVVLWKRSVPNGMLAGARFVSTQATIAPDGSSIVYTDSSNGGWMLMRKQREASNAEPLAGTEGGVSPFFSPDGKSIGFLTIDGKLKKLPESGGSPITLTEDVPSDYNVGAWLDDNTIIYLTGGTLMRIASTSGAKPRRLRSDSLAFDGTVTTIAPLPGSRGFLFTACNANCAFSSAAYVYDLAADSMRRILPQVAGVWYSPTGHVLYTTRDGGLFAAAFDVKALMLRSDPVPVIDGVLPLGFSISRNGSILYALDAAGVPEPSKLMWVDRQGRAEPFDSSWGGRFDYPAISPDGRSVAVSDRARTTELWIRRADGSRQKVNGTGVANWRPAWLSDGQSLTYISLGDAQKANDATVYRVGLDAGSVPTQILRQRFGIYEAEISPDSQWVVFRIDATSSSGIFARRMSGDTARQSLTAGSVTSMNFGLSPNGQWLAFMSDDNGAREVYVESFPDAKTKRLVSRGGGSEPRWARSGRELFFETAGQLMVVSVLAGTQLQISEPRMLFSLDGYRRARNHPQYDVAPGDQRFLMIKDPLAPAVPPVVFVQHWFPELLAKVKR